MVLASGLGDDTAPMLYPPPYADLQRIASRVMRPILSVRHVYMDVGQATLRKQLYTSLAWVGIRKWQHPRMYHYRPDDV